MVSHRTLALGMALAAAGALPASARQHVEQMADDTPPEHIQEARASRAKAKRLRKAAQRAQSTGGNDGK